MEGDYLFDSVCLSCILLLGRSENVLVKGTARREYMGLYIGRGSDTTVSDRRVGQVTACRAE